LIKSNHRGYLVSQIEVEDYTQKQGQVAGERGQEAPICPFSNASGSAKKTEEALICNLKNVSRGLYASYIRLNFLVFWIAKIVVSDDNKIKLFNGAK